MRLTKKVCPKCGVRKLTSEYDKSHKDWRHPDGLDIICVSCRENHCENWQIKSLLRSRFYSSIKKDKEKQRTFMREFVGCEREEFFFLMAAKFQEGMSWENWGEWHIDHIIPFAYFDLIDPEQQKQACHHTNLQPIWASENQKKSSKVNGNRNWHWQFPNK